MKEFEGRNENSQLWKQIEETIGQINRLLIGEWDSKQFKDFYLEDSCYTKENYFIVDSMFRMTKEIEYKEDRNGKGFKEWNKKKLDIENNFKLFFKSFKLPEQSYKPVLNPLLGKGKKAILNIQNLETDIIVYSDMCKILGIKPAESIYDKDISFILKINKDNTYLENNVMSGLNDIGNNKAFIEIEIITKIRNDIEYCKYVTNSGILSPVLFHSYLNSQLNAYLGYNEYPTEKINNTEISNNNFSKDLLMEDRYISAYPGGQIYYIPPESLSYNDYIAQCNSLYDQSNKKIKGQLKDLKVIRNKIIKIIKPISQVIYTDSFGEIQKLDLMGFEYLNECKEKYLRERSITEDSVINAFRICKMIALQHPELEIKTKLFDSLKEGMKIKDITEEKYPELISAIRKISSVWESFETDILLKMKSKIYLDIILKKNLFLQKEAIKERREGFVNISRFNKFPISLLKLLQMEMPKRNRLMNFENCFRDEFFIREISNLQFNGEIRKSAIISNETTEISNRIQNYSQGKINTFVLNNETLTSLVKMFGEGLGNYLRNLPENTVFIINSEIFLSGHLLGEEQYLLANKKSKRLLIAEMLNFVGLDYICVYKNSKFDKKDIIPYSLRILFSLAKYRTIYGEIELNDSLIMDPNTNLDGESNESDLKKSSNVAEEEVRYNCDVYDLNGKDFLYAMPNIEQYIHKVKATDSQMEFYKELYDKGFENIQNNKDFNDAILTVDLEDWSGITKFYSNYLSQADIFLNAPDSDLFVYKEKFQEQNNPNLENQKLNQICNICCAHLYGGEVESNKRKDKRYGKLLIVCENMQVLKHISRHLIGKLGSGVEIQEIRRYSDLEISEWRSKNNVIGITTVENLKKLKTLGEVSTYVIIQNEWTPNFLNRLFSYIQFETINGYGNPLEEIDGKKFLLNQSIDVHFVLFDNSFELNKMYLSMDNWIKGKIKRYSTDRLFNVEKIIKYSNPILFNMEEMNILDSIKFNESNIVECYKETMNFENRQSESYKELLSDKILRKIGIRLPLEELLPLAFDKIDISYVKGNTGAECFCPLQNNLYLNKFYNMNLLYYRIDEKFSDINGNEVYYEEGEIHNGKTVVTQFGTGKIKEILPNNVVVEVENFKEVVVPKNEILIAENDKSLEEYYNSIKGYGDSRLNGQKLVFEPLKKKDSDIELDVADNTISLNLGVVNGLFSIYSMEQDSDNIRLENYGFRKYTNLFVIDCPDEGTLDKIIGKLSLQGLDIAYKNAIQTAFSAFLKGTKFKLPTNYNYFACQQIKTDKIRIYPLIWGDKFFIIMNGNFYQKIGLKISRKFKVNLIKSIYIEQFDTLKDCRFELIKVSRVLDIINLQSLLPFFDNKFEKRELLRIQTPDTTEQQIITKKQALDAIRAKEKKLKQRIKYLRELKNAK